MQFIDMETWGRKDYFNTYLGTDFPYINIGANLDVTGLLRFSRSRGLSSYLTLVFTAHQTAESIVNFRYRICDGKPVVNERMFLSFTHLSPGRDLFINVTLDPPQDLLEFHDRAREQVARQGTDLGLVELRDRLDIIMYSAIPWIQYTHFVRTLVKAGVDSNPKVSWGKYFEQAGRTLVPFSVQVHHGLMDGLHVGRYFEELQRRIAEMAEA
jgi:chloramphenicol O-acetyltransferase type A